MRSIAIAITIAACGGDRQATPAPAPAPAPAPISIDAQPPDAPPRGVRGDGSNIPSMGRAPKLDTPTPTPDDVVPSAETIGDLLANDDTSLSPQIVKAKIASVYLRGLQRCYKDVLRRDPTKQGKVSLRFTVNQTGRTISPEVNGFDDDLTSCIRATMSTWTFRPPKDKDGEATEAGFVLSIVFVPS